MSEFTKDYNKPRLSIEITPEMDKRLKALQLPVGIKSTIFRVLLEQLIPILEIPETRGSFIATIINKDISLRDLVEPEKIHTPEP